MSLLRANLRLRDQPPSSHPAETPGYPGLLSLLPENLHPEQHRSPARAARTPEPSGKNSDQVQPDPGHARPDPDDRRGGRHRCPAGGVPGRRPGWQPRWLTPQLNPKLIPGGHFKSVNNNNNNNNNRQKTIKGWTSKSSQAMKNWRKEEVPRKASSSSSNSFLDLHPPLFQFCWSWRCSCICFEICLRKKVPWKAKKLIYHFFGKKTVTTCLTRMLWFALSPQNFLG